MRVVVIEITCRDEPSPYRDSLSRDIQDNEVHILEAWPGSVEVQRSEQPGGTDSISGFVLDATGSFPEGISGMLLRVTPEEARAHHAEIARARSDATSAHESDEAL